MLLKYIYPKRGRYWKPVGIFLALFCFILTFVNMISTYVYFSDGQLTVRDYLYQEISIFTFFGLLCIAGIGLIFGIRWAGALAVIILLFHIINAVKLIILKCFPFASAMNLIPHIIYLSLCVFLVYIIYKEV